MTFYTIPATEPFADGLAGFADQIAREAECPLPALTIYLPTRRSLRTVREAFLRRSEGRALLLPRLYAIGDADDEGMSLLSPESSGAIPPAIDPGERQVALARLLEQAWKDDYDYIQALALAAALGRLIDQIHTAGITLDALDTLVTIREFSEHWTVTLDFLRLVLGTLWPAYLEAAGRIDPGMHRRMHIESLTRRYKDTPPRHPVIIAGSTGSLPPTRDLIKAVGALSNGHVVLPGLDMTMGEAEWIAVGGGHPQYFMKTLLSVCDVPRHQVRPWGGRRPNPPRLFLISELMRPAATTERWQSLADPADVQKLRQGLEGVTECVCENEDEEARVIALAMAEIAADPDQHKTCALITPDRGLAQRVRHALNRWDIACDDSAGTPLADTPVARFALALASFPDGNGGVNPVPLLAALKSRYAGGGAPDFRTHVRTLEKTLFRGVRPRGSLDQLVESAGDGSGLLANLKNLTAGYTDLCESGAHSLVDWIKEHLRMMENLAATADMPGSDRLWRGDEGEAMASFFETISGHAGHVAPMRQGDYLRFLKTVMADHVVRPAYGMHPRLSILGPIEARMARPDRIILGGLNEDTWPPESGYDAFLSRPMRRDAHLPTHEDKLSLSAHDFATALGAAEVFLTHTHRRGGAPALPSRWLQRLDAMLGAAEASGASDVTRKIERPAARGEIYCRWAESLRGGGMEQKAVPRPSPRPAAERRPTRLSVTDIERWMRDPYAIYAKHVLRLRPLEPVDAPMTARDRGNLIHAAMESFASAWPASLPDDARGRLLEYGRAAFEAAGANDPEIQGLWWPRFVKAADWIIQYETKWRTETDHIYTEAECALSLRLGTVDYRITGKADRIERRQGGGWAIIDYKTGTPPAKNMVQGGIASQLPIEAAILYDGGFESIGRTDAGAPISMWYWSLGGSDEGGKAVCVHGEGAADAHALVESSRAGLAALLSRFQDETTPFYAVPDPYIAPKVDYNDYLHLERVREWSVADMDGEDA